MRHRIQCLLGLLLLSSMLHAQNNYSEALAQGKAALNRGDYLSALKKYFAAEAFDPSKKKAVQAEIQVVFNKIEKLRQQALKQAEAARQQAIAAEEALTKLKTATREKDEQQRLAEKAAKEKLEEVRRNFQSIVRLFSSKAKETEKMEDKRQFFGSAFRLSRDSLSGTPSLNNVLTEAAAECIEAELKRSDLKQSFEYSYINDFILLPSGKCYAVGGLGRAFEYHFRWSGSEKVLAPNVKAQALNGRAGGSKLSTLTMLQGEKGPFMVAAGERGQLYFHHPNHADRKALPHNGARIFDLVATSSQELLSVGGDSSLVRYDWKNTKILERIALPWLAYRIQVIEQENTAPALLIGGAEGLMLREGKQQTLLEGPILDFVWSKKDKLLFVVRPNQRLDIYAVMEDTFRPLESKKLLPHFSALAYQDGYLLIGYKDGDVQAWKSANITQFTAEPIYLRQEEAVETIGYYAPLQVIVTAGKGYMRFHSLDAVATYHYLEEQYGRKALSLTPDFYEQFIKK